MKIIIQVQDYNSDNGSGYAYFGVLDYVHSNKNV